MKERARKRASDQVWEIGVEALGVGVGSEGDTWARVALANGGVTPDARGGPLPANANTHSGGTHTQQQQREQRHLQLQQPRHFHHHDVVAFACPIRYLSASTSVLAG